MWSQCTCDMKMLIVAGRRAWDEHDAVGALGLREPVAGGGHAVALDGQDLSDPQLIAFSRNVGELDPPGPNPYGEPFLKQHPELNVISNVKQNGKPIGNLGDGEAVWHADMTYVDVPPKAALPVRIWGWASLP